MYMLVCLVRVRGDLFSSLKFFGWCAIHMYFHVHVHVHVHAHGKQGKAKIHVYTQDSFLFLQKRKTAHVYINEHVHVHVCTVPGLEARLEIFNMSDSTSALPFLRPFFPPPPPSDSELDPSLDELPLLLLLLELLLELQVKTDVYTHVLNNTSNNDKSKELSHACSEHTGVSMTKIKHHTAFSIIPIHFQIWKGWSNQKCSFNYSVVHVYTQKCTTWLVYANICTLREG